jgi:hypothetical protein
MSNILPTRRCITARNCIRNYDVAEQWLSTYRMSNDPRHLQTARICFVIADGLYEKSADENLDSNQVAMQQVRHETRQRVTEAFAALGYASCTVDDRNMAAAPVEGSRNPNQ